MRHEEHELRDPNDRPLYESAIAQGALVPTDLRVVDAGRGRYELRWSNLPATWSVRSPHADQSGLGLLESFIRLGTLDMATREAAQEVLTFARRWGVLSLCGHGLPSQHAAACALIAQAEPAYEPITAYAGYATHFTGLLSLAQSMKRSDRGRVEDWAKVKVATPVLGSVVGIDLASAIDRRLGLGPRELLWDADRVAELEVEARAQGWPDPELRALVLHSQEAMANARLAEMPPPLDPDAPEPISDRQLLAALVNRWLLIGDARLSVEWITAHPDLRFGGGRLATALAAQLLLATTAGPGILQCDSCGRFYLPKRKPRAGQSHYCTECRSKGSRIRMQKLRSKQRSIGANIDQPEREE